MRNRHKTLLRDHLVPEVTLKACPRHYSVSAVPETLTVRGPKRPPTTKCSQNNQMFTKQPNVHKYFYLFYFMNHKQLTIEWLPDRQWNVNVMCVEYWIRLFKGDDRSTSLIQRFFVKPINMCVQVPFFLLRLLNGGRECCVCPFQVFPFSRAGFEFTNNAGVCSFCWNVYVFHLNALKLLIHATRITWFCNERFVWSEQAPFVK